MYLLTKALFLVMIFVAGMATTVFFQIEGWLTVEGSYGGVVNPLFAFDRWVYVLAIAIAIGLAWVFRAVSQRLAENES